MECGTGRSRIRAPELDGQLVAATGSAIADGLIVVSRGQVFPYAHVAEWQKRGVVEARRALDFGNVQGDVVQRLDRCLSALDSGCYPKRWRVHSASLAHPVWEA